MTGSIFHLFLFVIFSEVSEVGSYTPPGSNIGIIAGGTVGSMFVLVAVIASIFLIQRYYSPRHPHRLPHPSQRPRERRHGTVNNTHNTPPPPPAAAAAAHYTNHAVAHNERASSLVPAANDMPTSYLQQTIIHHNRQPTNRQPRRLRRISSELCELPQQRPPDLGPGPGPGPGVIHVSPADSASRCNSVSTSYASLPRVTTSREKVHKLHRAASRGHIFDHHYPVHRLSVSSLDPAEQAPPVYHIPIHKLSTSSLSIPIHRLSPVSSPYSHTDSVLSAREIELHSNRTSFSSDSGDLSYS